MILNCKQIKEEEKSKLKLEINKINTKLTLAIIQIGYFEENNLYLRQKRNLAKELGIDIKNYYYDDTYKEEDIIMEIISLNNDNNITGIMIQKPIHENFNYQRLVNYIEPNKDIDGLTDINQENIIKSDRGLIPCTALSVLRIFDYYNINIENRKIAIIGKSPLVGKPLYNLLSKNNTVTLCDSKTTGIKEKIRENDLIIVAVGTPNFIKLDMIKENHIIIDVGTNYLNNQLVGDCDFNNIQNKVSMITPVPGGVGQLTPLYLFHNLIEAYSKKRDLPLIDFKQ